MILNKDCIGIYIENMIVVNDNEMVVLTKRKK